MTPEQVEALRKDATERAKAKRAEQEAWYAKVREDFRKAIETPKRWISLPPNHTGHVDGVGNSWHEIDVAYATPELFKKTVEDVAAGKQSFVSNGKILLIDSKKRYWVVWKSERSTLLCYDGKSWLPERSAEDPKIDRAATRRAAASRPRSWSPPELQFHAAYEDATGKIHFTSTYDNLNGASDGGIHVRSPDGTWDYFRVIDPGKRQTFNLADATFYGQPGGRVVLFLTEGENYKPRLEFAGVDDSGRPNAVLQSGTPVKGRELFYDGVKWGYLPPIRCAVRTHEMHGIHPMPDGSLVVNCNGHFWTYWPTDALNSPLKKMPELIQQLDDEKWDVRERATDHLLAVAAQVRPEIERRLKGGTLLPEMEQRLKTLLAVGSPGRAASEAGISRAGGYGMSLEYVFPETIGKRSTFRVKDVRPLSGAGKPMAEALAYMDSSGVWKFVPLGVDPLADRVLGNPDFAKHLMPLPQGGWITTDGLRLDETGGMTLEAPPGVDADFPEFVDRKGRVFYQTGYIFDPSIPVGNMAGVEMTKLDGMNVDSGRDVYAWEDINENSQIVKLGSGAIDKLERPKVPWKDSRVSSYFVTEKSVIVETPVLEKDLQRGRGGPVPHVWLFDGQTWLGGVTLSSLINENLAAVRKLEETQVTFGGRAPMFASDGKEGLWVQDFRGVDQRRNALPGMAMPGGLAILELKYHDGKGWHDVSAEAELDRDAQAVQTLDDGAIMVFLPKSKELVKVSFKDNKFAVEDLSKLESQNGMRFTFRAVPGANGDAWVIKTPVMGMAPIMTQNTAFRYHRGEMTRAPFVPMGFDRKGRAWVSRYEKGGYRLLVETADGNDWINLEDPVGIRGMCRGLGGKMVGFAQDEIVRLELDESGGKTALKIAARHPLGWTYNEFHKTRIDSDGNLWTADRLERLVRITVPPEFWGK